MNKKEAIKQLINDFKNNMIAQGYNKTEDMEEGLDKEIAKALKIKFMNE